MQKVFFRAWRCCGDNNSKRESHGPRAAGYLPLHQVELAGSPWEGMIKIGQLIHPNPAPSPVPGSYYRKFIENFAEIALPLTDRVCKSAPSKIGWD